MRNFIFLFLSFCLFSCTSETYKGQSKLDRNSYSWIPFQGGEKVVFHNANPNAENFSMTYEAGNRKSVFNQISDCYKRNSLQDQCDIYSMEYNFVSITSLDKKNNLTYSLERGLSDGKFYDELKVNLHIYGNPDVSIRFNVFSETGEAENDLAYHEEILLGEKHFSKVYMKENNGQFIYFSKEKGIVAFQIDSDNLWIRM